MIFTVLSYIDLEPLMELDDYISAIWNNKFFNTGEFEIVLKTTDERKNKLIRNNFIAKNGTDEIAVIDLIHFSKDEDNGATMTIKGSFAESLLNRRIIWNKTLLKGNVDIEIQRLIKENAVSPIDVDRNLVTDGDKKLFIYDGTNYFSVTDEVKELTEIQIQGDTGITTTGVPNAYGIYEPRYVISNALPTLGLYPSLKIFDIKQNGNMASFYDNPFENGARTTITLNDKECYITYKYVWRTFQELYTEGKAEDFVRAETTKIKEGSTGAIFENALEITNIELAEQSPFSTRIKGLTKEEYNNNLFGISVFDNKIYLRIFWSNELIAKAQELAGEEGNKWVYCYKLFFGYIENSNFNMIKVSDYILFEFAKYEKTNVDIYTGADKISFATMKTYFTTGQRISSTKNYHITYAVTYKTKGQNERNYVDIGTIPNLKDKIELQVFGDNLLTKINELATLYAMGIKARYSKDTKTIYFDLYMGSDKSNTVIFSDDLDNLVSYDVGLSNSNPNVALVYSEIEENDKITQYNETAGASAGINRMELYIQKTGIAGYIGPDYTQQLIEEGNLSLQKATIAIENEIDPYSFLYREQFNLGDVVEVIIKDLNMSFKTRILEVREFNDQNGYTVDLVLGE